MQDVVQKVAQYKVYSTLHLTSSYHRVEMPPSDRLYSAFETDYALWQWKRILCRLTNAVPCFQRIVDQIIESNNYEGTYAYLENITVGGADKQEHDSNLTFNESKCV